MEKVLFICGSLNQTTIMYEISRHLSEFDCYFTPYYGDGLIHVLNNYGMLDFTVMGGRFRQQTDGFLTSSGVKIDYRGASNDYDLVVTCQDLIIQKNIRKKKVVLVQEGMTDPENFIYHLVKRFKLPRYLASTAATGLSDAYEKFCVASEGYREHFIGKGVKPEKIAVTGIPNFDNALRYLDNRFPYKGYVLVATSDTRETFKLDNREKFLRNAVSIANGRQLIFKLHPNEKVERSAREIKRHAPDAVIFSDGDINPMIANCDVLITQYSSVSFIGLALGKEVYSYFDQEMLRRLLPIQNGGISARRIAEVCRGYLS